MRDPETSSKRTLLTKDCNTNTFSIPPFKKQRERGRQPKRREQGKQTDRQTQTETHTDKDTQRQRHTETDTHRETHRDTHIDTTHTETHTVRQNVLSVSQKKTQADHSQSLNVSDRGRSCDFVEQHRPLLLHRQRVESVHEPQRGSGMGLWSASEGL